MNTYNNKVVCIFADGSAHSFSNQDESLVRRWFQDLWGVKEVVGISLLVGGVEVESKSLYRAAV